MRVVDLLAVVALAPGVSGPHSPSADAPPHAVVPARAPLEAGPTHGDSGTADASAEADETLRALLAECAQVKANNDELRKVVDLQRDNERTQKELVTRLDELEHGDDPKGSGERPWSELLLFGVLGLVGGIAIGRFALPERRE